MWRVSLLRLRLSLASLFLFLPSWGLTSLGVGFAGWIGGDANAAENSRSSSDLGQTLAIAPGNAAEFVQFLVEGQFHTHSEFPLRRPDIYALAFETTEEIFRLCPAQAVADYSDAREANRSAYATFLLHYREMGWAGSMEQKIAELLASGGLDTIVRSSFDPFEMAGALIAATGGCDTPKTERLIQNLIAVGSFGRPIGSPSRLVDEKVLEGTLHCTYSTDDPSRIESQRHVSPGLLGAAYLNPAGGISDAFTGLMMRWSCPGEPDSALQVSSSAVRPSLDEGQVIGPDLANRRANYFIDVVLRLENPNHGLTDDEIDELHGEIVKFESLEVSTEEVDAAVRAKRLRDQEAGRSSIWPYERDFAELETWMRMERYKAKYGRRLFDLAVRPNSPVPNYIDERLRGAIKEIR